MALVEMIMPKMGESIMEATILSWLKNVGDVIEQDESVLEVATDKVDTEVPATHGGILKEILAKHQLDLIFLIAPTTSVERQKYISETASGFLYYVSLKGVTGSNKLDTNSVEDSVRAIKQHSKLPVGVGFGIRDAESAAKVAKVSDAVVVGSPIVELVGEMVDDSTESLNKISEYLLAMRDAINAI